MEAAGPSGQAAAKPAPPSAQTPPKTPPPAGSKPAAATTTAAATTPPPVDGGWPRVASLPSGATILVYQPQIASWDKQKHIVGFSAVSYRAKAADKPAIGTIKLEADTKVALEDRLVSLSAA